MIEAALNESGGRVFGPLGAAARLGMPHSGSDRRRPCRRIVPIPSAVGVPRPASLRSLSTKYDTVSIVVFDDLGVGNLGHLFLNNLKRRLTGPRTSRKGTIARRIATVSVSPG